MDKYAANSGPQAGQSDSQQLNDKLHTLFRLSKYNELENQFEKLHGVSVQCCTVTG
jgi:hypothetical protein